MRLRVLVLEYRTHKVDNNGINANFVIPYILSFIYYLHHVTLLNYIYELVQGD